MRERNRLIQMRGKCHKALLLRIGPQIHQCFYQPVLRHARKPFVTGAHKALNQV